ncbi:MAG: hypothetical protein ACOC79_00785, partial [Thermodesulfobacteriota bacterium]
MFEASGESQKARNRKGKGNGDGMGFAIAFLPDPRNPRFSGLPHELGKRGRIHKQTAHIHKEVG